MLKPIKSKVAIFAFEYANVHTYTDKTHMHTKPTTHFLTEENLTFQHAAEIGLAREWQQEKQWNSKVKVE